MQSALPSWDDVAWLREQWEGPFMVKGVSRVDDAKRVVDLGASALSVSNHGGNNLDGTPAPLRALPAVVDAVGDQIEVLLDGGVRRGSDVVKALALGANAVMIGRAYLWGLAVAGQSGVENVLDILRGGIDSALLGLGKSNIDELDRTDVLRRPTSFESSADDSCRHRDGCRRAASVRPPLTHWSTRTIASSRLIAVATFPMCRTRSQRRPTSRPSSPATATSVLGLVGDVRSATDMGLAVETATRHFGRLDAVVACAGVLGAGAAALGSERCLVGRGVVGERAGYSSLDRGCGTSPDRQRS